MPDSKATIGLTWEPKLPSLSSGIQNGSEKLQKLPESVTWKPDIDLVDGLFVPPNDPRKLNKLMQKQVKDTAGKNWFEMPAPTITPEIKKDLQILKLRNVMDPKRHYKKGDLKSKALPKYFQASSLRRKGRQHLQMSCFQIIPLGSTGNAKLGRLRSRTVQLGLRNGRSRVSNRGNVQSKEGMIKCLQALECLFQYAHLHPTIFVTCEL
uniref:Fcf2 pre-rRNA processing C-terminal domain-containing protein n=1 Tax=Nelumbo nucifera TaxID=4432 RepID=A0A822YR38_NELNU|nr:TPA_asm: hypothetical protein HUJ06_005243 [Nelumbo nucifera]